MLTARQSTAVLLLALLHQSHEFATVAVRSRALRRQHRCSVAASSSDDSNVDAASAFLSSPRPATGKEAFDGSTWSVLLRLAEGGSTIFTMQLLEDETCRFSDSDQLGSWECEGAWVVIEKPKAFFDMTLFLSAKLQPPTEQKPKWRLVEGVVQSANRTAASADETSDVAPDGEDESVVELKQIGSFGANEFEEALLTTMGRFQRDEADDEERAPR
jgi:hypothetical protein